MGWTTMCGYSKQDVINHVMRFQENDKATWNTIAKCVLGNVLWAVVEMTVKADGVLYGLSAGESERFIACYRLGSEKGFGWGYKDMEESMHPCHYNCPLHYLTMAPEKSPEWRAKVRAWHAHQKDRSSWKAGDLVVYSVYEHDVYTLVEPYRKHSRARKSGWIVEDQHSKRWRLNQRMLSDTRRVADHHHTDDRGFPESAQIGLL